jgi:GH15 family glucan-1,4-alpha-glucosidase
VLQALSFQPTGAIVAAPTTSLPEWPGGERNWDYRYSWVRDASLTLQALWVAACPDEAREFFDFLTAAASASGRDRGLQVMFGVGGERDLAERPLPHLSGWRGSRPVRVGNGAWTQRQLDVYGAILTAVHRLADQLGSLDESTRAFLRGCADAAAEQWTEKDHGIWEVRGEPRHFLHSKVMCWSALDRALQLTDLLRPDSATVGRWRRVRDQIRQAVLRDGWNADVGAFTQSFGSDELDASALTMPIMGILPADDPRMLATIDAIDQRLTDERGLVYRYDARKGLDGLVDGEGSFVMCTFWLAHALALAGQAQRAREVFERAATLGNDVGLFAEQAHPVTGEALGNFPQAFSHIGLVDAAWALHQAA